MAKDPAFLFYPNDWIGGTMGMSFEEKGVYMELLMMQFNIGHMTLHMIGRLVGQNWDKVRHKFAQDENGLWFNERLDIEKEKRKNYVASRKNNKKGKNQFSKNDCMNGHMTEHMENENTNANEFINKNKKVGAGENKKQSIFCAGLMDIDQLKDSALLDKEFKRQFDQHGIAPDRLGQWLNNFNSFLKYCGITSKEEKEYRRHFANWLPKQDIEAAENYSPVPPLNINKVKSLKQGFARIPAGAISGTGGY